MRNRVASMFDVLPARQRVIALALVALLVSAIVASPAGANFGYIRTIAGTSTAGYSGDGGQATSAQLRNPRGVAVDDLGNLYIADSGNHVVRKIDTAGVIRTIAGNGSAGFSGDGGPATQAQLQSPEGIEIDRFGNLFIADTANHRVRKVDAKGTITTIAGNGSSVVPTNGVAATSTGMLPPRAVAVDTVGNLYIGGWDGAGSGGLYKVSSEDGKISNLAPNWTVSGVATDRDDNVYFSTFYGGNVYRVDSPGTVTKIAGIGGGCGGTAAYAGDGGPATDAELCNPRGITFDDLGNLYIAEAWSGSTNPRQTIRKVAYSSGIITTIAGGGDPLCCDEGDGGLAINAALGEPWDVAVDHNLGTLYIASGTLHRIREVNGAAVHCAV